MVGFVQNVNSLAGKIALSYTLPNKLHKYVKGRHIKDGFPGLLSIAASPTSFSTMTLIKSTALEFQGFHPHKDKLLTKMALAIPGNHTTQIAFYVLM